MAVLRSWLLGTALLMAVARLAYAAEAAKIPASDAESAMDQAALGLAKSIKDLKQADKDLDAAKKAFEAEDVGGNAKKPELLVADTDKKKSALRVFLTTQARQEQAANSKKKWGTASEAAKAWKDAAEAVASATKATEVAEKAVGEAEIELKKDPKNATAKKNLAQAQKTLKLAQMKQKDAKSKEPAAHVAYDEAYNKAAKQELLVDATTPDPEAGFFSGEHLFFEAGVVALSPYAIKSTNPMGGAPKQLYLDKSGATDVKGYLQARLRNRDAWNDARSGRVGRDWCFLCPPPKVDPSFVRDSILMTDVASQEDDDEEEQQQEQQEQEEGQQQQPPSAGKLCTDEGNCSHQSYGINLARFKTAMHLDYDFRVGFNFLGSSVSGTAVAGSGDVNVGGSLGLPILRSLDEAAAQTLNIEGVFDLITDRGVSDVHHREGIGLAWVLGHLDDPIDVLPGTRVLSKRVYEFSLRATANWMESPQIMKGRTVIVGDDRKPEVGHDPKTLAPNFERHSGVFGFDADLLIPVGARTYWTLGASVFTEGGIDPNPWTVRLGLTVALDKFGSLFATSLSGG